MREGEIESDITERRLRKGETGTGRKKARDREIPREGERTKEKERKRG